LSIIFSDWAVIHTLIGISYAEKGQMKSL
jgi:hypothetical protein